LRANQDRNDPYVRGKRRNIPTAYDDLIIHKQKSWKYLGRKHQYRDRDSGYEWHEYKYNWRDVQERMISRNLMNWLDKQGCFYEHSGYGGWNKLISIKWFGPAWWIKGHCPKCYTRLVCDALSSEFGDWCPNDECLGDKHG
jgi:hypothetical protein